MNPLFEKNMAHLAALAPQTARLLRGFPLPEGADVFASADGSPTAVVRGISLHSRYDPSGEAVAWANGFSCGINATVFGFGLGYHVLALAEKCPSIIVVEPDPGMVRLGFENLDFSDVMNRLRFVFTLAETGEPVAGPIIPHPPSVRLNKKWFERWQAFINGNTYQTAGEIASECAGIEGIKELLEPMAPDKTVTVRDLARVALDQSGPPPKGAVFIMMIDELNRI